MAPWARNHRLPLILVHRPAPVPDLRAPKPDLSPSLWWWPLAALALLFGGLGIAMVDGRRHSDTVPGLPWFDEVHFVGGGIALAVGVWAFRRDILVRAPRWHRAVGLLYVAAVLCSSTTGLVLGLFSEGGGTAHLGFLVVGALWLATTLLGWRAIRARQVVSHRRWMVRSYALCSAAITLRFELPLLLMATGDFAFSFTVVAWCSWLPNLLFAEWWLSRTSVHGRWLQRALAG